MDGTNRLAKQYRMRALSFQNSIPSHKNFGDNRIVNRGCLAKQCATSALWVESIIIPNANDNEDSPIRVNVTIVHVTQLL